MNVVKSQDGFVSLLVNLAGQWEQPFASLPSEIQEILKKTWLANWDQVTPEVRQIQAAQYDHQFDPAHEASLYFELYAYLDELNANIDKARASFQYAVQATLQDVVKRIDTILYADRKRVGEEIQRLRVISVSSQNAHLRDHVSDRLAVMEQAATRFWANADRTDKANHSSNATVALWIKSQGHLQSFSDHAASYIRPSWAAAGRKPEEG